MFERKFQIHTFVATHRTIDDSCEGMCICVHETEVGEESRHEKT